MWTSEVMQATTAERVTGLLRQMEENIRWTAFALQTSLQDAFKRLMAMPGMVVLKKLSVPGSYPGQLPLSLKALRGRIDKCAYESEVALAKDCIELATSSPHLHSIMACIREGFPSAFDSKGQLREAEGHAGEAEGGSSGEGLGEIEPMAAASSSMNGADLGETDPLAAVPASMCSRGASGTASVAAALSSAHSQGSQARHCGRGAAGAAGSLGGELELGRELQDDLKEIELGDKRSRAHEKEIKYEQFKKQQRLHPEYAGVYADAFLGNEKRMRNFQELLVFERTIGAGTLAGVLQIEPHTTVGELRQKVEVELGFVCEADEELALSRGLYYTSAEHPSSPEELCPILLTQNHKVVQPLFPLASQVLVVEKRAERLSKQVIESVRERAQSGERILCFDVSRGHERQPIPVFNGADSDPAPIDFTYVTECVVNEGLRLLLGGPMRDPCPCPYATGSEQRFETIAYNAQSRFLHPPHTIESVYECTLASGCGMECKNRLVQRGPNFRLEVIRCMERESRFVKGWGVRSPDFIPRGSFICEYIGEYISDDEAESRGIRYDNQKMSRLCARARPF